MKMPSLVSDVDAAAKEVHARSTWFTALPEAAQVELLAAKEKWHAGGYAIKRLRLAKIIVSAAKARGWKVCDARRMSEWLEQND